MDQPTSCERTQTVFSEKLEEIYKKQFPNEIKTNIGDSIVKWLTEGTESKYINKLLSSPTDERKNFPIWWSGFYLEEPDTEKNPIEDMKNASRIVNGYSSVDTLLTSSAFNEQNKFWNHCSKEKENFDWGTYLSKTYTNLALKDNPTKLGLFINKEPEIFIKSYFYKTEFELIKNHYMNNNVRPVMYIFNLKDNCDGIKEKLIEKGLGNITLNCITCEKLEGCANNIITKIKNGGRKKRRSLKKGKSNKKKKSNKKRKSKKRTQKSK